MNDLETQIRERCHPSCRTCVRECLLLQQLGVNGGGLVEWKLAGGDLAIAYSCSSCDLCASVCNRRLDPGGVLKTWRQFLSECAESSLARRSLRQTDLPGHLYERYSDNFAVEDPYPKPGPGRDSFFPGCAMSAFTPDLSYAAFELLRESLPDIGWLEGCCYDPLEKLGFINRFETATRKLYENIAGWGIERIITVCPTCTCRLQALLQDVQVISIYEWMASELPLSFPGSNQLAVHDACPDRNSGRIGKAVRTLLGVSSPVMKHEGKRSLCCGAGGDVPAFNPSLSQAMAERRLAEAEAGGARALVTYCTTCAVQLASYSKSVPVVHTLDLLLGLDRDYHLISERVSYLRGQVGEGLFNREEM